MLRSLSLRWKILIALLGLSLLPVLLVTMLFTQLAGSHFHTMLLKKANLTGSFVRQSNKAGRQKLESDLKTLQENYLLINNIDANQLGGNIQELHVLLQRILKSYNLDRIEILNQGGTLDILSKNDKKLDRENLTEEEKETLASRLSAKPDNRMQLIRGNLTLTASVPLEHQGKVIARLTGVRLITYRTATQLHKLIGAELAFHNGNNVIASSTSQLANLNLQSILKHTLQQVTIDGTHYALFPFALQNSQGGFFIAIDRTAIHNARTEMEKALLLTLISILFLAALAAIIVSRGVTTPLQKVVDNLQQIAEGSGDLTRDLPITSNDEVGVLASSFNCLMARLRTMIELTRKATGNVGIATLQISNCSAELNNEAREQSRKLGECHLKIKGIDKSAENIADEVASLVASVQQSSAATHEFGSTTQGISQQMESLFAITSEISSSMQQLSSSNQLIDGNVSALSQTAKETAQSIKHMDVATRLIEEGANQTRDLVEQSAKQSLAGKSIVLETINGISALQQTVEQARQSLLELNNRSDAIGNIVNVISEIADQTNLLALNATIIAAQAGEHGRGFAVVASEIRSLAERTSISTSEIADIIENLQEGTHRAVNAIEAGSTKAEQEVARSQTAGDALEKLHHSSVASKEQVEKISKLTRSQTEESRVSTQAVLSITETLQQIATSIGQQNTNTHHLAGAAEQMIGIAERVKTSVGEQKRGSQQISIAMEMILGTIEKISSTTSQQSSRSQEVTEIVGQVAQVSEKNAEFADQLQQIVQTLAKQAEHLQKDVGAFKVS